MKTLTLLGCSSCIILALSGCGSDPITLGELIEAANDGDDGAPRNDAPPVLLPPVETTPPREPTPAPTTEAETYDPVEAQVLEILRVNCSNCHVATSAFGNLGAVDDIDALIDEGMIVPGHKEDSPLFVRMDNQTMPPAFERVQRPTAGQIELVGLFIDELE
jgi:hypothetical protein